MHEEVLKRFLVGESSSKTLADDLVGSMIESPGRTSHPITDMQTDFEVLPEHLIQLCDAVLDGEIEAKHLEAIGFCILASDHFEYDSDTREGNLVAETVADWSSPTINYALTSENVRMFRERLQNGSEGEK